MGEGFRVRVTQALLDRLAGRRPAAQAPAYVFSFFLVSDCTYIRMRM